MEPETPREVEARLKASLAKPVWVLAVATCVLLVLVVVLLGLGYETGRDNHKSLTILRCAVSKKVNAYPQGSAAQRTAFEACVKHGGPVT